MNAPGKGLLKVISVLYIVFGAIFAVLMLLSLFLSAMLVPLVADYLAGYGAIGALVGGILFVVFLVPAAVNLIFGIIGVKSAGNPSKATFFIVTGIILTVLSLSGVVFSEFSVWNLVPLVMPVLFIVGGALNKKAATPVAPAA